MFSDHRDKQSSLLGQDTNWHWKASWRTAKILLESRHENQYDVTCLWIWEE